MLTNQSTKPFIKRHLSYANIAATTALVVAVGGGGAAVAASVAKNSVGSPQIRNGQVKTVDLGKNAVTGAKVKHDSLTGADIKESTLALPKSPRVAESAISSTGTLSSTQQTVATLSFTAPAQGYVLVRGSANYRNNTGGSRYINASIFQDGTSIKHTYQDPGDQDSYYDLQQSIEAAAPVTAGAHTYTLRLDEVGTAPYSNYYEAQLVLEWVPAGSATITPRKIVPRIAAQPTR